MWIIVGIIIVGLAGLIALPFAIIHEILSDWDEKQVDKEIKRKQEEYSREYFERQRKRRIEKNTYISNLDARTAHLHIENPNDKEQKNDSRAQEEKGTHIV